MKHINKLSIIYGQKSHEMMNNSTWILNIVHYSKTIHELSINIESYRTIQLYQQLKDHSNKNVSSTNIQPQKPLNNLTFHKPFNLPSNKPTNHQTKDHSNKILFSQIIYILKNYQIIPLYTSHSTYHQYWILSTIQKPFMDSPYLSNFIEPFDFTNYLKTTITKLSFSTNIEPQKLLKNSTFC